MSDHETPPSRRGFLWGAAAVGAATAAVATLPRTGEGAAPAAPVAEKKPAPDNGGGYHVSEHVKRYYKSTLV